MNIKMSERTVVGKRYTIVVPKSVRKRVKIEEGQPVLVTARGETIVVRPLPKDPYASLARIIGEPYDEKKDERKVDEWLRKQHASA